MIFVVSDTHGSKIEFESQPEDILIHCGDWETGEIITAAKKILVRGDADILPTDAWDIVVDGLLVDHIWFTHQPAFTLPLGAKRNIFGHLHTGNINDFGYQEKEWHFWLPPNGVYELEKFLFESRVRKNLENQRRII